MHCKRMSIFFLDISGKVLGFLDGVVIYWLIVHACPRTTTLVGWKVLKSVVI